MNSLTPDDIEAIARRVAEVLADGLPARGYVDTATVAAHLSLSPDWVRAHAADLGAIRVGDPHRGPLRFDIARVRAYIDERRIEPPAPRRPRRRPGPARGSGNVELLPIPSRKGL